MSQVWIFDAFIVIRFGMLFLLIFSFLVRFLLSPIAVLISPSFFSPWGQVLCAHLQQCSLQSCGYFQPRRPQGNWARRKNEGNPKWNYLKQKPPPLPPRQMNHPNRPSRIRFVCFRNEKSHKPRPGRCLQFPKKEARGTPTTRATLVAVKATTTATTTATITTACSVSSAATSKHSLGLSLIFAHFFQTVDGENDDGKI